MHCTNLENKRPLSADLFIVERLVGRSSGKSAIQPPQGRHREGNQTALQHVKFPRCQIKIY